MRARGSSRASARAADFADPLFHTGLKPGEAHRLKPED
jgi:hypothetical protein